MFVINVLNKGFKFAQWNTPLFYFLKMRAPIWVLTSATPSPFSSLKMRALGIKNHLVPRNLRSHFQDERVWMHIGVDFIIFDNTFGLHFDSCDPNCPPNKKIPQKSPSYG